MNISSLESCGDEVLNFPLFKQFVEKEIFRKRRQALGVLQDANLS